ncbi:MAG: hypothetical protein AAF533_04545 [Acidobacteriota bacterium]
MQGPCESYEEWKQFITGDCGISLRPEYVAERVAALSNDKDPMTARFVELYGDAYRKRTIQWFERAGAELSG